MTFVSEWIGLKNEDSVALTKNGPGRGFVKVANKIWIDDLGFELEEPDFFPTKERCPRSYLARLQKQFLRQDAISGS